MAVDDDPSIAAVVGNGAGNFSRSQKYGIVVADPTLLVVDVPGVVDGLRPGFSTEWGAEELNEVVKEIASSPSNSDYDDDATDAEGKSNKEWSDGDRE
ncbi:uncharacterized protein JN550_000790 [Neoarthrinium moseri]|uniref:uncharacterized protein n=1 Tax=Neoarthrinium moseri TaxID=1658444 RepID=UPI001FDD00B3|nr:uncharacterized protein JN550_000790 [Neoarthrinium moseri]KAI1876718.1 hypothetical protein JN550_000790 [Neoarthrinium moseri]